MVVLSRTAAAVEIGKKGKPRRGIPLGEARRVNYEEKGFAKGGFDIAENGQHCGLKGRFRIKDK
jgi:hypothetical protein